MVGSGETGYSIKVTLKILKLSKANVVEVSDASNTQALGFLVSDAYEALRADPKLLGQTLDCHISVVTIVDERLYSRSALTHAEISRFRGSPLLHIYSIARSNQSKSK